MTSVRSKATPGKQPEEIVPPSDKIPAAPGALPPERAEAQKGWLHPRGTDKLLKAVRDAGDRQTLPPKSISERSGPS